MSFCAENTTIYIQRKRERKRGGMGARKGEWEEETLEFIQCRVQNSSWEMGSIHKNQQHSHYL